MTKNPEDKIIKARTIQTITYLVIGVLCIVIVISVITVHKNSLKKIDELKEIKNDIKIIKEYMVIIGEKAGMTPSELTVLDSSLQGTQVGGKQSAKREVADQKNRVTESTMNSVDIPDKEVEPSTASLLRERLKSYGGLLEKNNDSLESKKVEETIEPIPLKVPEEDLHITKVTNMKEKTLKSKSSIKTIQKYHIVKRGETLSHIAKKYNISIQELGKLNNIDPSQLIYPGQKLMVSKESKK